MDKPDRSRNHKLTERQKSGRNPHLSDDELLLALDGELSGAESAEVKTHVEACWSCRSRRGQIERAIRNVVEYRDHLSQPYLTTFTGGRSIFVNRLEQLAASIDRPPLWKRALRPRWFLSAISQIEVPHYVWVGSPVVVILAFFAVISLWHVPKVSASQLLEYAHVSEIHALQGVAKPIVYQKLRIRIGSEVVTRSIYRDALGMRLADHLDAVEGGENPSAKIGLRNRTQGQSTSESIANAEFRQTFSVTHLSWEDPLSPDNYSNWYKSLDDRQDEITTGDDNLITLKTTTSEGPITEASITLRSSNFHPVAEDLQLQDGQHVEVRELAWNVLPMDQLSVAIFEPAPTVYDTVSKRLPTLALQPPMVTDSELAEAELRVRVAIHGEKADLGEPIELDRDTPRTGPKSLVVRGVVSTSARKNELLAVLEGIPHVELHLQTIEEAQSQQDQVPMGMPPEVAEEAGSQANGASSQIIGATPQGAPTIVVAGRPSLQQKLEERFPTGEGRTAFVNETVELVQGAMAEAWALRRLSDRYTPDMLSELNNPSREDLELLIRDNFSVLRQNVDKLRVRVLPLISSTSKTSALESASGAPSDGEKIANDWRDGVMSVFFEVKKVNDDCNALLAESSDRLSDPQGVVRELQQTLAVLDTQLPAVDQQLSRPFLTGPGDSDEIKK